jgi:predicted nicotinamide N-methyase
VNTSDWVEEPVPLRDHLLTVRRPRDASDLVSEEEFEDNEFMPYWAELWASGRALAETVVISALRGASVLELGCGLALPSFAAALAGGRVVASDWSSAALEAVAANAELNGLSVETMVLDWFAPPADLPSFDLVLGSDLLYEERNAAALVDLLPRLGRSVLLADPGRDPAGRFFADAARDWTVRATGHPAIPNGAVHRLRRR